MSKIIRYCKLNEDRQGNNVFDLSYPNVMSNPYSEGKGPEYRGLIHVKTREEAIFLYEKYFDIMIQENRLFREEYDKIYNSYINNDITYLGCICKLNEPCHCDIVLKKIRQRGMKDMLNKLKKERNKQ